MKLYYMFIVLCKTCSHLTIVNFNVIEAIKLETFKGVKRLVTRQPYHKSGTLKCMALSGLCQRSESLKMQYFYIVNSPTTAQRFGVTQKINPVFFPESH